SGHPVFGKDHARTRGWSVTTRHALGNSAPCFSPRIVCIGDCMATDGYSDHFVTARDGLRLHLREYGERTAAGLPVVCLPGLARTCADFDTLATALAGDPQHPRRVLALDYRGRGLSDHDPNPDNYSIPVELDDVLSVLTARAAESAVVVGHSRRRPI